MRVSLNTLGNDLLLCTAIAFAGALLAVGQAKAQRGLDLEDDTLTQAVLIHPPIKVAKQTYSLTTREHTYRSQLRLGDQLARDFTVQKVGDDGIPRTYRPGSGGEQNEDWYGWRSDVLAPLRGTVARVVEPDTTNVPGTMIREAQPGIILFEDQEDSLTVAYAHVREIEVEEGQTVEPGQVVAKVGNNANSRNPHVHVGAWKGDASLLGSTTGTPLQIQVDLYAEERHSTGEAEAGE
ncbi:MAG: M23 family metallopeptidase [Salinibacter sp.]|uniref:M23 family metallopeptidase n=1 Tax=Salinibacter sp. TaxID=2065818 RepID=UPI0035D3F821